MKILLTGGTGLIGQSWRQSRPGDQFTILTRRADELTGSNGVNYIADLQQLDNLDDFDLVVNLAGEPIVGKRWSDLQKQAIRASRIDITRQLAALFAASESPPGRFISGSAIGIYGDTGPAVVNETTPIDFQADDFAQELCRDWEAQALAAGDNTCVCLLRTGIVLSPRGGALAKMLPAFKLGLGGRLGSGQQMMSWVHLDDMVAIINYLIDSHPEIQGAVNITAPQPVSNAQFSSSLARACRRPCLLPVPAALLRLALGEASQLLLDSQRVESRVLQEQGYPFLYSDLDSALASF